MYLGGLKKNQGVAALKKDPLTPTDSAGKEKLFPGRCQHFYTRKP